MCFPQADLHISGEHLQLLRMSKHVSFSGPKGDNEVFNRICGSSLLEKDEIQHCRIFLPPIKGIG